MSEINKETLKNFAEKLAKKEVSIRNEEGKGIDIPAPVALVGGALMLGPAVVGSVAAMAMGYKISVNDCEDPCKESTEHPVEAPAEAPAEVKVEVKAEDTVQVEVSAKENEPEA